MIASNWSDEAAASFTQNAANAAEFDLGMRVYSSRLLGSDPDLVLHGGGNTSVKVRESGKDGAPLELIRVKASGWDLATLEAPGLPALRRAGLDEVRRLSSLDDRKMVAHLRANLIDQGAPTPSIEALLHAYLPAKFVDHAHATATLVIANQPNAAALAQRIYGARVAVVPYVMPGFDLSIAGDKAFKAASADCAGLFLVNHGIFAVGEDARTSYERIIEFSAMAEAFIGAEADEAPVATPAAQRVERMDKLLRATLMTSDGPFAGGIAIDFRTSPAILRYLALNQLEAIASRGTVTPDHVIRIKPFPLVIPEGIDAAGLSRAVRDYEERYRAYFERNAGRASETKTMLDTLPRVILVPGLGVFNVGKDAKAAAIVGDLSEQTCRVILAAERIGRFSPISEAQLFDMEYWSLEQAKLAGSKS